jgi:hypothetical protein
MECLGWGSLWCEVGEGYFVLYEEVKDCIEKDGVVVIQTVSGCVFLVNVKLLNSV